MKELLIAAIFLSSVVYQARVHAVEEELFFSRSGLIERANEIGRTLQSTLAAAAVGRTTTTKEYYQQDERSLQVIDDGSIDLQTICTAVQQSFQQQVTCSCAGNIADSFSISCEYAETICNSEYDSETGSSRRICGKPQIAISLVNGKIFSATTCVSQYTRGTVALQDTCVFVDACPDDDDDDDSAAFCDCTASYGGMICDQCQVCEGGHALTVDCTNVNAEALSAQCRAVDLDLHLSGGAGSIAGFAPVFAGFCSQIESALNNTVSCDCTEAVGGNFSLACQTNEPICVNETTRCCGTVESTVAVVDGQVDSVTACASYEKPFGVTCTALQLCNDGGGGGSSICGCVATYNDVQCNSCSVCEDGDSITLDCSNVYEHAVTEQCQAVTATTSYEFLPSYSLPEEELQKIKDPESGDLTFNTRSSADRTIGINLAFGVASLVAISGVL